MCHQHEADARQVSSSRTPAGLLQKLTAGKAAMMPARMPLGRFPAVLFLCAAAAARAAAVSLGSDSGFHWTPAKVILAVFLFFLAGLCEIGGGWLVWQAVREGKPAYWAIAGALVLIGYGFVPTAQPISNFGRIYAVYGGFFILLSYAWGWAVDKEIPDAGDIIGATVAVSGVVVAFFFPR